MLNKAEMSYFKYIRKWEDEGVLVYDFEFSQNHDDKCIEVRTTIEARKKGNEALQLIAEHLQEFANVYEIPFIHVGVPTSNAAHKLFKRTSGYVEKTKDKGHFWKKIFNPEKA